MGSSFDRGYVELNASYNKVLRPAEVKVEIATGGAYNYLSQSYITWRIAVLKWFEDALNNLTAYDIVMPEKIKESEKTVDKYEDKIANYLLGLSSLSISEKDSLAISKYLHIIGDIERMSDHSVSLMESAREIKNKKLRRGDI